MKKTDTKITRYEHGNFYVDIVETENGIEAWLTHMNYGVSGMMFRLFREQHDRTYTDDELLEIVEENLDNYEMKYCTNMYMLEEQERLGREEQ